MEYLMAEFDKMEINLDRMLLLSKQVKHKMTSKEMRKEKL